MALTLLQTVNLVLRRAGVIGDDLIALTSQTIQEDTDAAVAAINEAVDELGVLGVVPTLGAEGTIVLATGDRDYAVASDYVQLADDLFVCETDGSVLYPYNAYAADKGFADLRRVQLQPDNETGSPNFYTVDPTNGQFYLDKIPTSAENGKTYRYLYQKEVNFSTGSPSATFPILDEAVRQLVPAAVQLFSRARRNQFDEKEFQRAVARAAKLARRSPPRSHYGPHS